MKKNKIKKITMLLLIPMFFSLFPNKIAKTEEYIYKINVPETGYYNFIKNNFYVSIEPNKDITEENYNNKYYVEINGNRTYMYTDWTKYPFTPKEGTNTIEIKETATNRVLSSYTKEYKKDEDNPILVEDNLDEVCNKWYKVGDKISLKIKAEDYTSGIRDIYFNLQGDALPKKNYGVLNYPKTKEENFLFDSKADSDLVEHYNSGNYSTYTIQFTPQILDGTWDTASIPNITKLQQRTLKFDLQPPTLTLTNIGNGKIDVLGTDGESGIKKIQILENGSWKEIGEQEAFYTVSKNGTYSFKAVDNVGLETVKNIEINNIDNTAPTLSLSQNPTAWTNGNVAVIAKAEDENFDYILLPNGEKVTEKTTTYEVSENGSYTFKAYDKIGNVATESINITNIDKNKPEVTGAEDYIQDPTKEEAGSSKTINITVTEPKDYLGICSGLKYAKLFETTDGKDTLIVNKESNGAKELEISYKNDKEGKRSFRLETEDRAGNKVTKEFMYDIKPKNEILSLANTYRVYSLNCIDKNVNFGPRNPSLDILTGVYGEMEVTVKGSMLLDAEFYKGNQKINGMFFTGDNMVNYSGVPSKMPLNPKNGDNPNDNKISIKMQDPYLYPYQTQTVKFKFILPNIGTNNVEKDMPISIKLVSYNNTSCIINNVLGKNFFTVKGDARADLNINNIR